MKTFAIAFGSTIDNELTITFHKGEDWKGATAAWGKSLGQEDTEEWVRDELSTAKTEDDFVLAMFDGDCQWAIAEVPQ
jgi:hypothetical protein